VSANAARPSSAPPLGIDGRKIARRVPRQRPEQKRIASHAHLRSSGEITIASCAADCEFENGASCIAELVQEALPVLFEPRDLRLLAEHVMLVQSLLAK
jgi:hypothetical protein